MFICPFLFLFIFHNPITGLPTPVIEITAAPNQIYSTQIIFDIFLSNCVLPQKQNNTVITIQIPSDFIMSKPYYCSWSTCYQLTATNTILISVAVNQSSSIDFQIGGYNHIGDSNFTSDFLFTFIGDGDPYYYSSQVTLQPLPINNLNISLSNYTTTSLATITFAFLCPIQLSSGFRINVYFPFLNPEAPANAIRSPLPDGVQGLFSKGLNLTPTITSTLNLLEIVIQEVVQPNTTLIFEIYSFLTPNTVGMQSGIDFYILYPNSGYVLQNINSSYLMYTPNSPKAILITSSLRSVNQIAELNFTILPLSFLNPNSSLLLKFPIEFPIQNLSNASLVTIKNMNNSFCLFSYNSSFYKISHFNQFYIEGDTIDFSLNNIVNPGTVMETSSFQITLIDENDNLIERQSNNLTYFTGPGVISEISIILQIPIVDEISDCTISFLKSNPLNSLGEIQIDFPLNFNLSSLETITPVRGITNYSSFSIVNQSVILSSCFTGTSDSSLVSFILHSIITPKSVSSPQDITITTKIDYLIVDTGSALHPPIQPAGIQAEILLDSQMSMSFANYQFFFTIDTTVYNQDNIEIEFPPEYIYPFLTPAPQITLNSQTTLGVYSQNSLYFNVSLNNNSIQMPTDSVLSVIVKNIRNPHLVLNTSNFNVYLKDSNGLIRANLSTPLSVEISQTSQIFNWNVTPISKTVSFSTSYYISFILANIIQPNDKITIELPPNLGINSGNIFSVNSPQLMPQYVTLVTPQIITMFSGQYVDFNTTITIMMSEIDNPNVGENASPFKLMINDNLTTILYAFYVDLYGFSNYQPMNMSLFTTSFQNYYIGAPNNVTVTFKIGATVPQSGTINIDEGEQFLIPLTKISCQSQIKMTCATADLIGITLRGFEEDIPENTTVTVVIQGFRNLDYIDSQPKTFTITTRDNNSCQIETAQNLMLVPLVCIENCNTCVNNYTNCTSCIQGTYLLNTDCVNKCPQNYYANHSLCQQCLTPQECTSCNPNDPLQCIQCDDDHILYQGNCFPNTADFKQILNITSNGNNSIVSVLKQSAGSIIFFDTDYDNKPYLSAYVFLSFLLIAVNRFLFKNKHLNTISCLIFLWCLLDLCCLIALIIKFIFIGYYLYLLGMVVICSFQFALHLFISIRLWSFLKKEAVYVMNLESHCCFKFPHILTFGLNYRFSYIFFSGFSDFGRLNLSINTRADLLKILKHSLIFNVLISLGLIALLVCFIVFRFLDNQDIPWFFYEYTAFLAVYIAVQLIRILKSPEVIPKDRPKLELNFTDLNKDNVKESPKAIPGPKRSIIAKVLANLTSGKKNINPGLNQNYGKLEISHSPLLPIESSRNGNDNNLSVNSPEVSQRNHEENVKDKEELQKKSVNVSDVRLGGLDYLSRSDSKVAELDKEPPNREKNDGAIIVEIQGNSKKNKSEERKNKQSPIRDMKNSEQPKTRPLVDMGMNPMKKIEEQEEI